MRTNHKLGIIVPYRNRYEHLEAFKQSLINYFSDGRIDYELIIVEQDDAKLFNRGMLLNIGFTYAKKLKCDYVVFHDVDMIPLSVDYSYSDTPLHLSTDFQYASDEKKREVFDTYFGGVTMFPTQMFESIDGYSNKYWGWGYEDDDLLLRCRKNNIPLNNKNFKNIGNRKVLKLNGIDSYIKVKNVIDFNYHFTLSLTFCPDELKLDHNRESDEFTIFSIPGYDFAISYTSFHRYNFCAFDYKLNSHFINSEIKPNYLTNITITYDCNEKIISVYQDGILIGKTDTIRKFLVDYKTAKQFYIGVGNPNRETIPNWFKGYFKSFAYFDEVLSDDEIYKIGTNLDEIIPKSTSLQMYYDASKIYEYKLKDLSGHRNYADIVACEMIETNESDEVAHLIPHRRKSKFKSLKHDENGFLGNKWKNECTRWNQLRFINEVIDNDELLKNDGLSTLEFIEYGVKKFDKNIRIINVGI